MRLILAFALLGSLCLLAAVWQERWTDKLLQQRDLERAQIETPRPASRWSRLVIGRPSNAQPLPYPEDGWAGFVASQPGMSAWEARQEWADWRRRIIEGEAEGGTGTGILNQAGGLGPAGRTGPQDWSQDVRGSREFETPRTRPDFEYTVRPRDVLGTICQAHYGTARATVIDAVASYNSLSNANDIGAGDILLLPDMQVLLPAEK